MVTEELQGDFRLREQPVRGLERSACTMEDGSRGQPVRGECPGEEGGWLPEPCKVS